MIEFLKAKSFTFKLIVLFLIIFSVTEGNKQKKFFFLQKLYQ